MLQIFFFVLEIDRRRFKKDSSLVFNSFRKTLSALFYGVPHVLIMRTVKLPDITGVRKIVGGYQPIEADFSDLLLQDFAELGDVVFVETSLSNSILELVNHGVPERAHLLDDRLGVKLKHKVFRWFGEA